METLKTKLTMSAHVIKKIVFWNANDKNKEISGSALYKIVEKEENGFPKNIMLEDFVIHDLGSAATTEFTGKLQAEIFKKWIEQLKDDDYVLGIIHSHVNMATNHSGVDTTEMKESTPQLNFFISTIFNHSLKVSSKISYKDRFGYVNLIDINNIVAEYDKNDEFYKERDEVYKRNEKKTKTKTYDYSTYNTSKGTWNKKTIEKGIAENAYSGIRRSGAGHWVGGKWVFYEDEESAKKKIEGTLEAQKEIIFDNIDMERYSEMYDYEENYVDDDILFIPPEITKVVEEEVKNTKLKSLEQLYKSYLGERYQYEYYFISEKSKHLVMAAYSANAASRLNWVDTENFIVAIFKEEASG